MQKYKESKKKTMQDLISSPADETQEELEILEHSPNTPVDDASSDDEIEIVRPKKTLTDRQKETLLKAREKRTENIKRIREEKEQKKQEEQKETEEKIVKKAIAIKKKQIKKDKVIELTPEEEEVYEEPIKAPVRKINPQPTALGRQSASSQYLPPRNPVKQPEPEKPRLLFV